MEEFDEASLPPRPKPSKVPSWIMLGFLFGAVFVWALPDRRPPRADPAPAAPVASILPAAKSPRLTDVEAAFEEWKAYALWADNITYVTLWDSAETRTFRDCFQVLRQGDEFFYRSVPRPRDLRPREDVPKECPLEFLLPVSEVRRTFRMPAGPPMPVENLAAPK